MVIWRCALLPPSETFVRQQGDALTAWRPTFVGARRVPSFNARASDVIAYGGGRRDRAAFALLRATGRAPRLRKLLAGHALVHAHFGGDGWLISDAAARAGVPLVVTVHGYDVTRLPALPGARGLRHRRHLRAVFERAALVLAVSGHIRDRVLALGADPARLRVHHTGVPIPPLPPPAPPRWDVLFVGRFVEKKGLADLVDAVGALGAGGVRRPRVLLIGAGPLEGALRARAAALGVDATFGGVREPAEVRRAMSESRLFVSPSRTAADGDSEGLPTTILEAASLGLPTVATRHSGIPEAVLHGRTGLLGPEGDPATLARHIRVLLADDERRARYGAAARERACAHFDLHRQTRLLEELYDGVATR
ncbi:glycosyl transferase family 1 [Pilimelia anulata]|uniref:Glycosyl transferase family 1 n=1 Tax=Pilimelia anulata TaxID=53371 RepID=A0A8J3AZI6_9ACTN|nr:glycosyl transferase family 1 [Pilimelia anulata]